MSIKKPPVDKFLTKSAQRTQRLGFALAQKILQNAPQKRAVVLALQGDLGAGKTTFIQGFAKGLGVKEKITSPTFVLMKKFQIPKSKCQTKSKVQNPKKIFQFFYHFDCYRLQKPEDVLALGFSEIIANPQNIVAIEWSEHIKNVLPKDCHHLYFEFVGKNERKIGFG